ncbi:hypothetical protein BYT27DRAFT_7219579 [Phlegmacium glaucopus]|nr:hypothetical protein BYT27DRAFT_7219579 [Phlegmacium glaucopus]
MSDADTGPINGGEGLDEHSARANNHFKSGNTQDIPYFSMGEDKVMSPHDPPLTDRECLGLHAEIKSLQERLGISYKDASHRLYMSQLEKLKAEKDASKAFSNLKLRTDGAVKMFNEMAAKLAGQDRSGGKPHGKLAVSAMMPISMPTTLFIGNT